MARGQFHVSRLKQNGESDEVFARVLKECDELYALLEYRLRRIDPTSTVERSRGRTDEGFRVECWRLDASELLNIMMDSISRRGLVDRAHQVAAQA